MSDERVDLNDMLYDVAKRKKKKIFDTDEGTNENKQATKEFIDCIKAYRDLQKDGDDFYLETQKIKNDFENKKADREIEAARVENETKSARRSEEQKDRFDICKIALEAAGVGLSGIGLIMSFVVLTKYQDINLESVISNRDAVGHADSLFNSIWRKI